MPGQRLFDHLDPGILQQSRAKQSLLAAPGLIDIDPHTGSPGKGHGDRTGVGTVVLDRALADLELEMAVSARCENRFSLCDVTSRITTGKCPSDLKTVSTPTAQQIAQ
jgi:hypothetical protein